MQVKQKNLRVFEINIEDERVFLSYLHKNYLILKDFLLVISGDITDSIRTSLKSDGLIFIEKSEVENIDLAIGTSKEVEFNSIDEGFDKSGVDISTERLVIEKTVRSGEEVISRGDIIIFSRVNSGAIVYSDGNIEIYGKIDGVIESNGEYLILKTISPKGEVIFQGEVLDRDKFRDKKIKKVTMLDGNLVVKDL